MTKHGRADTQPARQRYLCPSCERRLDALPDTLFAGQHPPRRVWILCLYCRGLNRSNPQIAPALALQKDDAPQMTRQLRPGMGLKKPSPT
jgi:hypothetical protein